MRDPSVDDLDHLDTASTVRLPVRNTVLAQLEAALLAEKLSLSDTQVRRKGIDPYNRAPARKDAWGHDR
jgi:hypothetical protein